MTQARMTAVFEYDLAQHEGNPFFVDTPFGRPLVLELGDYSEVDCEGDDLAQAPAPVRVKALRWEKSDTLASPLMHKASSQFGQYEVGLEPWQNGSFPMFPPGGRSQWLESEEAAKAAAQADYEARILAALEAPGAGVAELVEAWDAARSHEGVKVSLRGEASRASWDAFLAAMDKARAALTKLGAR